MLSVDNAAIAGIEMDKKTFKGRLQKIFSNCNADKILLMNTGTTDPNFLYATGFTSGLFEYSRLILDRKGGRLLTSILECETAKAQAPDGLSVSCIGSATELKKAMKRELDGFSIGINESFMPVKAYRSLRKEFRAKKLSDVSKALEIARLTKGEDEIASIHKAVGITKLAMVLVQKAFKEGMTETELGARFNNISAELGSQGPSFKTIVCFGENAAFPHHAPDGTKLGYGDLILIDAGSKINNYCSDLTRTFIFGENALGVGRYGEKKELMKVVKEAQVKAIRAVRPGMKGKKVDSIARKYIESADGGRYKGKFIHSLGHSLGIEVHDGPGFSPNEETVLKEGMVVTVEPGIYIKGFGGVRIEDDILITKEGAFVL